MPSGSVQGEANGATNRRTRRGAWLLAVLWLCALFFAIENRLIAGAGVPAWDARDLHAPNQILLADHARAGRLLFWNPWTQAGSPSFADPQSGTFSPVSVALGAWTGGSARGFTILWLSHWLLGGLGILALAARLGAPPWGALVPAIGWLYCGLYVGQAQHVPILISFSYLPLILLRLDVAAREERWLLPAVQAGALWGLSALSGYPAMTILNPAFAASWVALRWRGGSPMRAGAIALAFGIVGGIVLAPSYTAILHETIGYSDSSGPKTREVAIGSDALDPGAFATFASPHLLAVKLANPRLWPRTDVTMCSLYCGASVLCLALLAVAGGTRSRFRLGLVALAALSAALAVGDATPLRGWLYDLFPPSRFFRHAALFRVYTMFAVVVLAACGTIDLWRALANGDRAPWRRFAVVSAGAALVAIAAFAWVVREAPYSGTNAGLARLHVVSVWLGIAVFSLVGPALERRRHGLAALALLFMVSSDAVVTHALSPTLYSTHRGLLFAWSGLEGLRSPSLDLTPHGLTRMLETQFGGEPSGMNVALKIATFRGYDSLRNSFHERWLDIPVLVSAALQEERGRPRTWFASEAPEIPLNDEAWQRFAARAEQIQSLPLVLHRRETMLGATSEDAALPDPSTFPAAQPIAAVVERYTPEELAIEVDCPRAGWILVTDRWARSWRATVDGAEVPIFGGDFLFRAVRVHAGVNRVRFRYEPSSYLLLTAISWSTLAVVAVASGTDSLRRRRRF